MNNLLSFETCSICARIFELDIDKQIPMILSGDGRQMQCDTCNHSYKLPDCEGIREVTRHQREIRYADKG